MGCCHLFFSLLKKFSCCIPFDTGIACEPAVCGQCLSAYGSDLKPCGHFTRGESSFLGAVVFRVSRRKTSISACKFQVQTLACADSEQKCPPHVSGSAVFQLVTIPDQWDCW